MYGIFVLSRTTYGGYDTYSSCVVVAQDAETAKLIHPNGIDSKLGAWWKRLNKYSTWAHPDTVNCVRVGTTETEIPGTVLCASFHAG